MSDKISTFIGDVVRWVIALILLPTIIWILFLFFIYPFEWLLLMTTNWGMFFHIVFWFMIGGMIISFTTAIGGMISVLSMYLVRQSTAYLILFSLGMLGLIIFCIYGAWSGNIQFSWEQLRFSTFNRILFTVMILQLLQIPSAMFEGASKQY